MIKMMEEIENMQKVIDSGIVSPRDVEKMEEIIQRGYTIIGWLDEQKDQITSALYDRDKGKLVFDIQNTSGLDFKRIQFDVIADGERHLANFNDWKNGEYEKVHVTHFFQDTDQMSVTIDVQSVAYELMDASEEDGKASINVPVKLTRKTVDSAKEQFMSPEALAVRKEQARNEVMLQCVLAEDDRQPSKEEMTVYLKYLGYEKEEIEYALKALDDNPDENVRKDVWIKTQRLRVLNNRIDDPSISENIDELIEIGLKIAGRLEEHPECRDKVRRFRNYYLPTLITNLKRYEEVEEYNSESKNHAQIRQSVDEMIDACKKAFHMIYDSLYEDDIIEADVDKDVMKKLLIMDGLLEE